MRTASTSTGWSAEGGRIRAALLCFFAVTVLLAGFGCYYRVADDPPYIDYDSATMGIFVNNLTFHDQHDFFFRDQVSAQFRYRVAWATQFLPLAVPLSWTQRLLALERGQVGVLLHVYGCLAGILGCLLAAMAMAGRDRQAWVERAFVVAFVAAAPPFVLYLRTEVANIITAFLLFWLAILLFDRWLRDQRPWQLYALAVALTLVVLIPYPPLLALPIVFAALLWRQRMVPSVLRDRHVYAAAVAWVGLVLAASFCLAMAHTPSYGEYLDRVSTFYEMRGRSLALANLDAGLVVEKVQKLVNQHLLFRRDLLGEVLRKDALWTLGSTHVVWLLLCPVALLGLIKGLRERQETVCTFAVILGACLALFLSFGFPEGRYLIVVVPCYAVLTLHGIRTAMRAADLRLVIYALVLLLLAGNTFWLLTDSYREHMHREWARKAGVVSAAQHVAAEIYPLRRAILSVPVFDLDVMLYVWMHVGFDLDLQSWADTMRLLQQERSAPDARAGAGGPIYVLLPPPPAMEEEMMWAGQGFEVRHVIHDEAVDRAQLLLWRPE